MFFYSITLLGSLNLGLVLGYVFPNRDFHNWNCPSINALEWMSFFKFYFLICYLCLPAWPSPPPCPSSCCPWAPWSHVLWTSRLPCYTLVCISISLPWWVPGVGSDYNCGPLRWSQRAQAFHHICGRNLLLKMSSLMKLQSTRKHKFYCNTYCSNCSRFQ